VSIIHGCNESGPQIFFDENLKDLAKSFWMFAQDFGLPEMKDDPVAGVRSLMQFDAGRIELLKRFLAGENVLLQDNHMLFRVAESLVPDQACGKSVMEKIFHKAYSGRGYFRDSFLPLDYSILPDTLNVRVFNVQNPPVEYADLMPTKSNACLTPFSQVLDVSFDVNIQLLSAVPKLPLAQLKNTFIYEDDNTSLYSVLRTFMEHPDKVWVSQGCKTCGLLPESDLESDLFFMRELFRENPPTLYMLGMFMRDFSRSPEVRKNMALFPEFLPQGNRNEQFSFERKFYPPVSGIYSYYFESFVSVSFGYPVSREDALFCLSHVCDYLLQKIRECRTVLDKKKFSLPWTWNNVSNYKVSGCQLMLWPMSADDTILKKVKDGIPKIRESLEEYTTCLDSLHKALVTLRASIEECSSENLVQDMGEMIVNSIKIDPIQYVEYPVPAIRKYVNGLINGSFFEK